MKYSLSPIASTINGPIGDMTFVKHRKSPFVRSCPRAPSQVSPSQAVTRSAYGALVSLWRSLLPEYKALWNTAGDVSQISGFNFFIQVNMPLETASIPVYMLPPTLDLPAPTNILFQKAPTLAWFDLSLIIPPAPSAFGWAYLRNPDSNKWESGVGGAWSNTSWKLPASLWNSQTYEYYTFDSDTPASNKGHWSNMSVVDPAYVTQGVAPNGLAYNRYDSAGGYNTIPYSASPGFFIQQSWVLSFWVYFVEPGTGDQNQYFLEMDPCLYVRRINFTSAIEVALMSTFPMQSKRFTGFADNTWYHVALQHDAVNNILYLYRNAILWDSFSYTDHPDRVSTRDYVIGGNPYRSSYKNIRIGGLSYCATLSRPMVIQYEALLRNPDCRGRILYPNSPVNQQVVNAFGASGSSSGFGLDNYGEGQDL